MNTVSIIVIIILIIFLIDLCIPINEKYNYEDDYISAMQTGIVTGAVYANPNYTQGLGWIN